MPIYLGYLVARVCELQGIGLSEGRSIHRQHKRVMHAFP